MLCSLLLWIAGLSSVVQAQDMRVFQRSNASNDILEQLRLSYGVTEAQKAQENLFLAIPLTSPNETEFSDTLYNSTTDSSSTKKRLRKSEVVRSAWQNHDTRQAETKCKKTRWQEGDDPCLGRENEPTFVPCDRPCKYTREVGRQISSPSHPIAARKITNLDDGSGSSTIGDACLCQTSACSTQAAWVNTRKNMHVDGGKPIRISQSGPSGYAHSSDLP